MCPKRGGLGQRVCLATLIVIGYGEPFEEGGFVLPLEKVQVQVPRAPPALCNYLWNAIVVKLHFYGD